MIDSQNRDRQLRRGAGRQDAEATADATIDKTPGGGFTRRLLLANAGSTLLLAACGRHAVTDRPGAPVVATNPDSASFLRLSQALTGHGDLDPITADRLDRAFATAAPAMKAHFASMGVLVAHGASAPDVLAAATAVGLRPVALAIVAAWYTGTVGEGVHALTVSYRDSLMQRPVADALSPPTYVLGGPAWWTDAPPEVRVPARAAVAPTASSGAAR